MKQYEIIRIIYTHKTLYQAVIAVSKVSNLTVYSSLASTQLFTDTGNSHAIWDHTVLPATWQR